MLLHSLLLAAAVSQNPAVEPVPRDERWLQRHAGFVEEAKRGGIDVLFLGDSITDAWRSGGRTVWEREYGSLRAANFGISGDRTQHVLWRLKNGEGEGFQPKLVVLMIGTNNTGLDQGEKRRNTVEQVAAGIGAVVRELRTRFASAKILLLAVFPRANKDSTQRHEVEEINRRIAKLHDGRHVHYLDIGSRFKDANDEIPRDVMPDLLHPNLKGYEIWADAIREPMRALWPQLPASRREPKVEVGYCSPLKDLEAVKAAGFDYAELRTSEIAGLSDEEYQAAAQRLKQLALPTPVANLFVPKEIRLTGPTIDKDQQLAYVKKAFERVSKLGVKIVVFGSSAARNFPEGFSKDEAFQQLADFLKRIGPEARARGITVAIEPLRRQESNIINTAAEGLELALAAADPNVDLMIDYDHLAQEQEDPEIVLRAKEHIRHLHVANPNGRVFPLSADESDYAPFFANLRKLGYKARISVEASTKDFAADAPRAIALLRRFFEE
jgi:sugar phosphate isomerase/epimerase/lysophospholipase L1-like esterase